MLSRSYIASVAVLAVVALLCFGCGKKSDGAPSLDATTQHPADWFVKHRAAYRTLASQCRECHGDIDDPRGGIVKISCTSTSWGAFTCHFGGHAPRSLPHAIPFRDAAAHGPAAKADLTYCFPCHGRRTNNGASVRFDMPIGLLANGCEDCHKQNTAHPPVDPAKVSGLASNWPGHATAGNMASACALCHGAAFNGGTGPACSKCHKQLQPGQLPDRSGNQCGSCHNAPPDGPDDPKNYPNIAGRHAKHVALNSGLSGNSRCLVCHYGGGNGTPIHGTLSSAKMSFLAEYTAKIGGVPTFNPKTFTCRNVSCHGGIETPSWRTGVINVNADRLDEPGCRQCHAYNAGQYNSFGSGQHAKHVRDLQNNASVGLFCTDCHDPGKLPKYHFVGLNTTQFEGPASGTLRDVVGYTPSLTPDGKPIPGSGRCAPINNGTSDFTVPGCHPSKVWQ